MKTYTFNFIGYVDIDADNESEAFAKFRKMILDIPYPLHFDDYDIIAEKDNG